MEASRPHSEDWLNETRDAWWDLDYLLLLARRFGFDRVGDVLDVGSGHGHWGQTLLKVLPTDARLTGVDREAAWTEQAQARAEGLGIADRADYLTGEAEHLPFPDGSFDLVTCQTVLIHVADVAAAIKEMIRVLRPGGRLVVAEPNNATGELVKNSVTSTWSVDRRLRLARFQMTCEAGKAALGLGDNSVGDEVPHLFAAAGLEEITAHLADKVASVFPPYDEEAQMLVAEALRLVEERMGPWPEAEARRYFLGSGGSEGDFEEGWALRMHENECIREEIEAGRFWSAGVSVLYVVGGRKRR